MGFFDTLRRVLGQPPAGENVAAVWGLNDEPEAGSAAEPGLYDQDNWHKKMKRVLDGLPGSRHEWPELVAEARALNLDQDWVTRCQVDEFLLLVRHAVSDRRFTEEEHRNLDLARDLIGIPEAEAEAALHAIVAEAESFFGGSVEGA